MPLRERRCDPFSRAIIVRTSQFAEPTTRLRCREIAVTDTVADMTREELRDMLETLIEQKLVEMLGDPDEGLEVKKSVRERLVAQSKRVAAGDRGRPLEEVAQELDLS